MRSRVPVTLGVVLSVLATTASADYHGAAPQGQSLGQTAGLAVGKACAEAWAARDTKRLDAIDGDIANAQREADRMAEAAERALPELERRVRDAEGRRDDIQGQIANLTSGRDTEKARLDKKRSDIGLAAAAFDGLAARRRSIEAQLADPNAPVKDGFDSRRVIFGGGAGGRDAADFSPRLAELRAQLESVKGEMRDFRAKHPVLDPVPAPDETSIRAAIAREIVDVAREMETYWRTRGGDPNRISDLRDKDGRLTGELDELRQTLGVAREQARVSRAFATSLQRVVAAIKVCTKDQREWLAGRRGSATGTPGPVAPPAPAGGLRGALELDCGDGVRRGEITFRTDEIPPPGANSGYTARLTWAMPGSPFGSLDNITGFISPEGPRSWSTLGVGPPGSVQSWTSQSRPDQYMFLAVMETGASPTSVERVRGMLCGPLPGAGGPCRGRFWTPAGAPMPPFEEELTCPAPR